MRTTSTMGVRLAMVAVLAWNTPVHAGTLLANGDFEEAAAVSALTPSGHPIAPPPGWLVFAAARDGLPGYDASTNPYTVYEASAPLTATEVVTCVREYGGTSYPCPPMPEPPVPALAGSALSGERFLAMGFTDIASWTPGDIVGGLAAGALYQDVVVQPGAALTLGFSYRGEAGSHIEAYLIDVASRQILARAAAAPGVLPADEWGTKQASANAISDHVRVILLSAYDTGAGNPEDLYRAEIDRLVLTSAVPEPPAAALAVAGLLALLRVTARSDSRCRSR
jgi:hypothetical protein